MATKQGTLWRETMLKRFGSEEALHEFMVTIASKGGKKGTGHAFGHGKVDPSVAGAIGGRVSRRTKSGNRTH